MDTIDLHNEEDRRDDLPDDKPKEAHGRFYGTVMFLLGIVIGCVLGFALAWPWSIIRSADQEIRLIAKIPVPPPPVALEKSVASTSDNMPYVIAHNDMLGTIACDFYGNGQPSVYAALATVNGIEDPNLIRAGATLAIPLVLNVGDRRIKAKYRLGRCGRTLLSKKATDPARRAETRSAQEPLRLPEISAVQSNAASSEKVFATALPEISSPSPVPDPLSAVQAAATGEPMPPITTLVMAATPQVVLQAKVETTEAPNGTRQEQWYLTWIYPEQVTPELREALASVPPKTWVPALFLEGKRKDGAWEKRETIAANVVQDKTGTVFFAAKLTKAPPPNSALAVNVNGKPVELASDVLRGQGKPIEIMPTGLGQPPPLKKRSYSPLTKAFRKHPNFLLASMNRVLPFVTRNGIAYLQGGPPAVAFIQVRSLTGRFGSHPTPPATPAELIVAGQEERLQKLEKRIEKLEQAERSDTKGKGVKQ